MLNFLDQNVQIFPLYILLTRRINTFWSKGFDKFWSGNMGTFWAQKVKEKKSTKFTNIFELCQFFICPKMFWYLQIIYYYLPGFIILFISKNWFYSIISSSDMCQSHHLIGCHITGIIYFLLFLLNDFCCVYSSYNPWSKNRCR